MKPPANGNNAGRNGLIEAVVFLLAAGMVLAGVFSRPLLTLAAEASRWF